MSESVPRTPDEAWVKRANCTSAENPDIFTPKSESPEGKSQDKVRQAQKICRSCPVQAECLAASYVNEKASPGIWGGETTRSRRKLDNALGLTALSWSERVNRIRSSLSRFE